jgi:multiple sugar transport system permease protein
MKVRTTTKLLSYSILILTVVFFTLPVLWLFFTSLKPVSELFSQALPIPPTLVNYTTVLKTYDMARFFLNSLVIAVVVTVLGVIIGAVAAYGFARYRFPLSSLLLVAVLVVRMVPGISLIIPLYLLASGFGMLNTRLAVIITELAFALPLAVWIMEGFFRSLPKDLDEAALIDGCSRLGAFFRVILPIAAPGVAVTAIFTFLYSWNEFVFPLVLNSLPESHTLPVALSQMNLLYGIRWDHMSAASMMYIIPTIVIAALLQRYIVQGLTAGAVKG